MWEIDCGKREHVVLSIKLQSSLKYFWEFIYYIIIIIIKYCFIVSFYLCSYGVLLVEVATRMDLNKVSMLNETKLKFM